MVFEGSCLSHILALYLFYTMSGGRGRSCSDHVVFVVIWGLVVGADNLSNTNLDFVHETIGSFHMA